MCMCRQGLIRQVAEAQAGTIQCMGSPKSSSLKWETARWAPILLLGWVALERFYPRGDIRSPLRQSERILRIVGPFPFAAHRLMRMWLYYEWVLQNSHHADPAHALRLLGKELLNCAWDHTGHPPHPERSSRTNWKHQTIGQKTVTQKNSKMSLSESQCSLMQGRRMLSVTNSSRSQFPHFYTLVTDT